MFTMFNGFHQFGFVARDLGHATAMLGERYGVTQFRRKRPQPAVSSRWRLPPGFEKGRKA